MRPQLSDPEDQDKYRQLLPLTDAVIRLHEAGEPYSTELKQMSRLLGRVVGEADVLAAFGSSDADEFARRFSIDWHAVPMDLSEQELLELFEGVCAGRGLSVHVEYWLRCIEANTGDDAVSDLIFWPNKYFGAEYSGAELAPAEMLGVVLEKRCTRR
ncbi:hypothetical protein [Variovorax sp. LG9.2]|uniref:hypothetical protein n=1 Tax=Variovorax sp. LG9.2 TaxID=3048626 RepID=UPI002B22CF77|nr:hypothetical protein [Variovorax sp. LG9.2]MEB0058731.1 hypothetical protein [Variovorax sp. LG9.2]